MDFILIAVAVLGGIGLIAALVLYVCSKKFAVYEDPRIAQVAEQLPGANCGMHLSRVLMPVVLRD